MLTPAGIHLRKALVIVQFTIAAGIIAATIISFEQLEYVQNKDLGFNKEETIVIPLRHEELQLKYPVLRQVFSGATGVKSVSGASGQLGNTNFMSTLWDGDKALFQIRFLAVDYGFMNTMGIKLLSGRNFSPSIPSDTNSSILVNEAAAEKLRAMGIFGKVISVGGVYDRARVIGVMKNFNYRPLYFPVQPLVVFLMPSSTRFMVVRLSSKNFSQTISSLGVEWKKVVPDYPLDWSFIDQDLNKQYHADITLSTIFELGAFLSIFISILGLFGLSNYAVEKRVKEIGIRKVLGASVTDLVKLLTKDFMLLVIIGSIAACPLTYYFISKWLQNFAYKIHFSVFPYLLAIVITFFVAVIVVGIRTIIASSANPVKSLRYE